MAQSITEVNAEFPPKLAGLFQPMRYKVAHGGRGSGKSWGFARALLLLGTMRPLRVLCARELQNSIKESVHKLLSDQIDNLGLGHFYNILDQEIRGANGTEFVFAGIRNNVNKIKSYEAVDICWVEEANKVTKNSWSVLIPTIRKPGSEIWATFNPELETDDTYQRFIASKPSNSWVVEVNWRDNPWFTPELMSEMEDLRTRDEDEYLHVWEGHCKKALEGAVFAKELRAVFSENRVCQVPYDRSVPVDVFWDLGRSDATALWIRQRVGMQFRVLEYYENSQEDISHYLRWLQGRTYLYGTQFLPHDARAKVLGTKKSIEEQVREAGLGSVRIVPKLSVVDGINAARGHLAECWFDKIKCAPGLNRLQHYKYEVKDGVFSKNPAHDENSHGADSFRYMAVMSKPKRERKREADESLWGRITAGATGWME